MTILGDYQAKGDAVYVVYDSAYAVPCAKNIVAYVQERRADMQVQVIPASGFLESMQENDKVIIIGRGELSAHYALEMEAFLGLWGISIAGNWRTDAFQNNLLVLRAAKIPAYQETPDEDDFIRYYEMIESKRYRELAEKYHIPSEFGGRRSFPEYQHDLLFLEGHCYIDSLVDKQQPEENTAFELEMIEKRIGRLKRAKSSQYRDNDELKQIDEKIRALMRAKKRKFAE